VDVKAFWFIKVSDGVNIYGCIVFIIYWQSSFFMGRFMGRLWAAQVRNVEERKEQNRKECDENSGRLLADCIVMIGWRIKLFMGGSNYLWAEALSLLAESSI
jgi:hypothetical protein